MRLLGRGPDEACVACVEHEGRVNQGQDELVATYLRDLAATAGFGADALRARVAYFGRCTYIPRRRNCGGSRPFSHALYRRRHRVEDFFYRIKRHRRISTPYDKLASTFFAFIQLAAVLDWLKN